MKRKYHEIRQYLGGNKELYKWEYLLLSTEITAKLVYKAKIRQGTTQESGLGINKRCKANDKLLSQLHMLLRPAKKMTVTIVKTAASGKGVVAVDSNLTNLGDMVRNIKIGTKGYVYMVDKDGNAIFYSTYKAGRPIKTDWVAAIMKAEWVGICSGHR